MSDLERLTAGLDRLSKNVDQLIRNLGNLAQAEESQENRASPAYLRDLERRIRDALGDAPRPARAYPDPA